MNTNNATITEWEQFRTDETRQVENILRKDFQSVDAYRYNSASLRLRIIDPSFKGLSREDRDDLVEPKLSMLDRNTQADIINLVLLYPDETKDSFRAYLNNYDFDHPSKSML